jgi:exo-beta-1,3-glucanase (GH17 family)
VNLYEVGNEPDINYFWQPTANVASYSAFLKMVSPVIRQTNSQAKIISAGLTPSDPVSFVNGMYANGAKGYFDYLGYHPYTWPVGPDNTTNNRTFNMVQTLHQIMLANGDDKHIMITEVGWPSTTESGGVTEQTQTTYIDRVFKKIMVDDYTYVDFACIYDFKDDGTSKTNPEQNFGILKYDYKKKPSFQKMIDNRAYFNTNFIQIGL